MNLNFYFLHGSGKWPLNERKRTNIGDIPFCHIHDSGEEGVPLPRPRLPFMLPGRSWQEASEGRRASLTAATWGVGRHGMVWQWKKHWLLRLFSRGLHNPYIYILYIRCCIVNFFRRIFVASPWWLPNIWRGRSQKGSPWRRTIVGIHEVSWVN